MTQISLIGNLTSPVELRFTANGKAVGNVTVAVNRKRGDQEETDFHRVTLWEQLAENAAQLEKGTRVVVVGRLTQRSYEDKQGEKRTAWDVTADAFGPDLRFATAQVTRAQSNRPAPQADDGWATAPAGGGSYGDDTPF
ncbi:single-stranded DNA-binding protein [Agromyces sp. G08B096]|uniref:Single-stranded DNA-binding protein n=1 Tax=Agromyces sp. G08B096 TaxID=3156399 RepID=A0AAU7W439_9MICO